MAYYDEQPPELNYDDREEPIEMVEDCITDKQIEKQHAFEFEKGYWLSNDYIMKATEQNFMDDLDLGVGDERLFAIIQRRVELLFKL